MGGEGKVVLGVDGGVVHDDGRALARVLLHAATQNCVGYTLKFHPVTFPPRFRQPAPCIHDGCVTFGGFKMQ